MDAVRFAIVGQGNIGRTHTQTINNDVKRASVSAVVSSQPDPAVPCEVFEHIEDAIAADAADVYVIATPTMTHLNHGQTVLAAGHHLVIEKPCAVTSREAVELNAGVPPDVYAAVMLNQRYHPVYKAIKGILDRGELGRVTRFNWIMTSWYRPDVYFQVSPWRGTWPGEGGGALMNQCIHNLDVLQWLLGMPGSVISDVGFGKHHDIEVEDEVAAVLSYENGMNGVVVASTGEAPGVNRLDIVGDRGTLMFDGETLRVARSDQSVRDYTATTKEMFGMPDFSTQAIPTGANVNQHACVFQNMVDAVLDDVDLETPLSEGIGSIELANAILLSAWEDRRITLPVDPVMYQQHMSEHLKSGYRVPKEIDVSIDMDASYR